jgi:hypothetical protein
MIASIRSRTLFLALGFLLSISAGMAGQGSQVQQNSHVSRDTITQHSNPHQQQSGVSHSSHQSASHTQSIRQSRTGSASTSRPQAHIAHAGRVPSTNAQGNEGAHDLNYGARYQQQMPGVGRGNMIVPAVLAAGRKSAGNQRQMQERNAQPSSLPNRQSAATVAGRGSSAPVWMRGGTPSGSQRKPNPGSRPNSNQR